jgi:hypothetical protein
MPHNSTEVQTKTVTCIGKKSNYLCYHYMIEMQEINITLHLSLSQHYHQQSDTLLKSVRVLLLSMHKLYNDVDGGIYRHKLAGISKVVPSIKETRSNQMRIGPGNEECVPLPTNPTPTASFTCHSGYGEPHFPERKLYHILATLILF